MPLPVNEQKCPVKGKIKCVFRPKVIASKSGKRNDQTYKVVASENLSTDFLQYVQEKNLVVTEKFDGTCCFIGHFHGRPWLWARHDIKPIKSAEKRFKAYQHSKNEHLVAHGGEEKFPDFVWDVECDFKEPPDEWVPASGVDRKDALPDDIGHIVGWVPVDPSLRQHLWHLSSVNLNEGVGLFLYDKNGSQGPALIEIDRLEKHCGKTFELIGTHVNGNPYKLGCKKNPIHLLVQHGEFLVDSFPIMENDTSHTKLETWFMEEKSGHLEGLVWHANDGQMFKLHRHHLNLKWPLDDLRIFNRSIFIDLHQYEANSHHRNVLFEKLKTIDGMTFDGIESLSNWSRDG